MARPLPQLPAVLSLLPRHQRQAVAMSAHASATAHPHHSLSVAVIGAGAAGLAAARELLQEGHRITVFEQAEGVGGVWRYSNAVEDDLLGAQPGQRVHGSMYRGLRTNLPREVMGFHSFPFDYAFPGSSDPARFCSHEEVLRYLAAFARHFDLERWVRFDTQVQRVEPLPPVTGWVANANGSPNRWQLTSRRASHAAAGTSAAAPVQEEYDAVVVCNGHFSEPRLPVYPGQSHFPGLQMHCHNYRQPEPFKGQTLVLVGAAFSGTDIAQELVQGGARAVYLSARVWEDASTREAPDDGTLSGGLGRSSSEGGAAAAATGRVVKVLDLQELGADGSVTFQGGCRVEGVDVVMYCTGRSPSVISYGDLHPPWLAGAPGVAAAALPARTASCLAGGASACMCVLLHLHCPYPAEPHRPSFVACTPTSAGYLYRFPFLEGTPAAVGTEDNRVHAVYQHVFPPHYAPTLSFVGLPWRVVPFPQCELQARWIARCLSGRVRLPGAGEMQAAVEAHYRGMQGEGLPVRYTHRQAGGLQREYNEWLTQACGPGESFSFLFFFLCVCKCSMNGPTPVATQM